MSHANVLTIFNWTSNLNSTSKLADIVLEEIRRISNQFLVTYELQ